MANSAHTWVDKPFNAQIGNVGKKKTKRGTLTFGSDYAAAVLPLLTAAEVGLSQLHAIIPEGQASGTAAGAGIVVAFAVGGANATVALFNGTSAIGTVNEAGTSIDLLILGN